MVGEDEPARKLRSLLERHGVTALLGHDPQLYTIVKLRVIGRAQQLIRVDFENQPDHEVLSAMLADYGRVPGLLHYLIVHPAERYVIHHRLGVEPVQTRVVRDGDLRLDPPGLTVPLADLFPPEPIPSAP